jgi:hypothetical protein
VRVESGALLQDTQVAVYKLDGSETSFGSRVTTRARAAWVGPNLVVDATRTYPGPQGRVSVDVKEVYSINGDRLTLEKTESQRGTSNSGKYVYARGTAPVVLVASAPPIRRDGGPVPRTPEGKPDMSGYWTGNSRAGIFDIEPHTGSFAVGGGPGVIVDPPDGRVPYQPWALKERDRRAVTGIASLQDPEPHCFLSGVPRQWYVMPYQIVQTPTTFMGLHEYVHARRIIPITTRPHIPPAIRFWQGDSRGRWEGDTLVVDVTNFNGKTWFDMAGNFYSENAHIVERYTMTDANTIRYEAIVEDSSVYTRRFKMTFNIERVTEKGFEVLESACHEDNQDLEHTRRINAAGGNDRAGTRH